MLLLLNCYDLLDADCVLCHINGSDYACRWERGRESVIRDGSIKKILKKKVSQELHMVVMMIRVLVKLPHIV